MKDISSDVTQFVENYLSEKPILVFDSPTVFEFTELDSVLESPNSLFFEDHLRKTQFTKLNEQKLVIGKSKSNLTQNYCQMKDRSNMSFSVYDDCEILNSKRFLILKNKDQSYKSFEQVSQLIGRSLFSVQNRARILSLFSNFDLQKILSWSNQQKEDKKKYFITFRKAQTDESEFQNILTGFSFLGEEKDRKRVFKRRIKKSSEENRRVKVKKKSINEDDCTILSTDESGNIKSKSKCSNENSNQSSLNHEISELEFDKISLYSLMCKEGADESSKEGNFFINMIEEEGIFE